MTQDYETKQFSKNASNTLNIIFSKITQNNANHYLKVYFVTFL